MNCPRRPQQEPGTRISSAVLPQHGMQSTPRLFSGFWLQLELGHVGRDIYGVVTQGRSRMAYLYE
jgi:hypothetical protein